MTLCFQYPFSGFSDFYCKDARRSLRFAATFNTRFQGFQISTKTIPARGSDSITAFNTRFQGFQISTSDVYKEERLWDRSFNTRFQGFQISTEGRTEGQYPFRGPFNTRFQGFQISTYCPYHSVLQSYLTFQYPFSGFSDFYALSFSLHVQLALHLSIPVFRVFRFLPAKSA